MTAFADYLEDKIINWSLRGTAMGTAPANVYISAHTGDPGETGASNEVTGNNYGRVEVSTTGGFDAPSGGATANAANMPGSSVGDAMVLGASSGVISIVGGGVSSLRRGSSTGSARAIGASSGGATVIGASQ